MVNFLKTLLQKLPWIVLITVAIWFFFLKDNKKNSVSLINQSTILKEIESLGKLELIKYNFQEITEIKKPANVPEFLQDFFPENKAVLISRGEAVGCINLTSITKSDIIVETDTVYVKLPYPELCYFKIDLKNSKIYDLQTSLMTIHQKTEFTQFLYQTAEEQIKKSALESGILENTKHSASLMLKPLLEKITEKKIEIIFQMSTQIGVDPLIQ